VQSEEWQLRAGAARSSLHHLRRSAGHDGLCSRPKLPPHFLHEQHPADVRRDVRAVKRNGMDDDSGARSLEARARFRIARESLAISLGAGLRAVASPRREAYLASTTCIALSDAACSMHL
jgi:hypothetical protein